jgi:hypothetical protein
MRTSHPLVGIRCLLDFHSLLISPGLVGRSSTAAADAEEPEECGGAREEDCNPGSSKHGKAEAAFDVVGFENVVECGGEDGEENGRDKRGCEGEEESNLINLISSRHTEE